MGRLEGRSLNHQGFWNHTKYLAGFVHDLKRDIDQEYSFDPWSKLVIALTPGRNSTRALLGSFRGQATVVCVDCCYREAIVEATYTDDLSAESGLRLPGVGYTDRSDGSPRPFHFGDNPPPCNPDAPFSDYFPKSLLPATTVGFGRKGYMKTISVKFTRYVKVSF